ncbi:hypothetical protein Tco_0224964, partial [Tanacetum coccineum]
KMPSTRSGASMTREEFEELVARRVAEEWEAREAARTLEPLISADKSKNTRKHSKASKHGHENQKSTKPKPQKTKALANFHLQGPNLPFLGSYL